jgi:1-acyl-sn-glycerol-3-phosphate acyltransferase
MVAISPEGQRSRTGGLVRAKPGVAFLAYRASVPILPMAFTNTASIGPALKRLRRAAVSIRIGEPFELPPLGEANRKRQRQDAADLIMCRLAALLPPEYRGVYADYPAVVDRVRSGRPGSPLHRTAE